MKENLNLLNDDSPTYPPHPGQIIKPIYLAICSSNLSTCFENFETSDLFRSDHAPFIPDF